jgi:pterin-4a-carbinolamine dehydratase
MNTQTAVEQTQDPQGNGAGPVQEPSASSPPAGESDWEAEERLKSERVQEALKAMTGWKLAHEEAAIERVKTFPTPEVAALYGAFVARFASAAGFFVTLDLAGGQVAVTVRGPQINGCWGEVTESVLAFARQLG